MAWVRCEMEVDLVKFLESTVGQEPTFFGGFFNRNLFRPTLFQR
jgi:hypothetical protein